MFRQFALASLALLTLSAHGKECKGVQFPESIDVHGTSLTLNGVGLRTATVFSVNVYVAAIYVVKPTSDPGSILGSSGPTQLTLHFMRGLSAGSMRNAWSEGFSQQGSPQQMAPFKERLDKLQSWMSDVKAGQQMTFTRLPGEGLTVALDGTALGTLPGDDFARAFLAIWLGEHPPTPALKSGLLGGACG